VGALGHPVLDHGAQHLSPRPVPKLLSLWAASGGCCARLSDGLLDRILMTLTVAVHAADGLWAVV
jgi:hypothetical protein